MPPVLLCVCVCVRVCWCFVPGGTAALIAAWESLQGDEVSYEAELLSTLDSYTKQQVRRERPVVAAYVA